MECDFQPGGLTLSVLFLIIRIMNGHTLLALIRFLHAELRRAHPDAPAAACWPTTPILNDNINFNRAFFPSGTLSLSKYRQALLGKGFIAIAPCVSWHECAHWQLTAAGLAALERMDREGCAGGCGKHRKLTNAGFKIAA